MDKPAQLQKQSLEILRLELECLQMARRTPDPELQTHFIRMARNWNRLATATLERSDAESRHAKAVER